MTRPIPLLPGMSSLWRGARWRVVDGGVMHGPDGCVTVAGEADLGDAATRGVVLELVRASLGEPLAIVAASKGFDLFPTEWAVIDAGGRRLGDKALTEADALQAAWEAAP